MKAKARILVSGLVQGVFFRAFTRNHALQLGLKGFVCNLDDGITVECLVAGDKKKIERLIDFLKIGPPNAKVKKVSVEWLSYKENEFNSFEIKR